MDQFEKYVITMGVGLAIIMMILSFTVNIGRLITAKEDIYNKCASACSTKHFSGLQVGMDHYARNTTVPYVNEYDRTTCLQNCNELYLTLKR